MRQTSDFYRNQLGEYFRQGFYVSPVPVVPLGLNASREYVFHGLAPMAVSFRHFVTSHFATSWRRWFTILRWMNRVVISLNDLLLESIAQVLGDFVAFRHGNELFCNRSGEIANALNLQ